MSRGPIVVEAWANLNTSVQGDAVIDGVSDFRVLGKKGVTIKAGESFTPSSLFYFSDLVSSSDFSFTSEYQGFILNGDSGVAEADMDGVYSIVATHNTEPSYTATVSITVVP